MAIVRIIAHWTAGTYRVGAIDLQHYHFIIDGEGKEFTGDKTVNDNLSTADNVYAAHTRGCNTGSVGVAVACMNGARAGAHGKYPMREVQFKALCERIAKLCAEYKIQVTPRTVLSHAEVQSTLKIAQRGKWDFTELSFRPELHGASVCGDYMRQQVRAIMAGHRANVNSRKPQNEPSQIPMDGDGPKEPAPVAVEKTPYKPSRIGSAVAGVAAAAAAAGLAVGCALPQWALVWLGLVAACAAP